jgi:glycine/D-amino acid oxidase-like deaminating enzyme
MTRLELFLENIGIVGAGFAGAVIAHELADLGRPEVYRAR